MTRDKLAVTSGRGDLVKIIGESINIRLTRAAARKLGQQLIAAAGREVPLREERPEELDIGGWFRRFFTWR